jgi:formate dehydrogenase subunit delta
MESENLVRMANNIAAFFNSDPDHQAAVAGVANHIRSFWESRMKKAIFAYKNAGGEGLDPLVVAALDQLQSEQK